MKFEAQAFNYNNFHHTLVTCGVLLAEAARGVPPPLLLRVILPRLPRLPALTLGIPGLRLLLAVRASGASSVTVVGIAAAVVFVVVDLISNDDLATDAVTTEVPISSPVDTVLVDNVDLQVSIASSSPIFSLSDLADVLSAFFAYQVSS